jgi:ketosteroid isomerase-like protein
VKKITVSRRYLLAAGASGLAAAASSSATEGTRTRARQGITNEDIVRKYYAAWEKKDWGPVDALLADDFTFTSAHNDDHISKSVFKTRCWNTQIDFIDHFELERIFGQGNEVFVKYLCRTSNGKSFRNVEYIRFANDKVEAIECYFGGNDSFPSAVSAGQS